MPYGGAVLAGKRIEFRSDSLEYCDLYFRAYLLPQDHKAKELLMKVLSELLHERNRFFVRPYTRDAIEGLCKTDWSYPFSSLSSSWEAHVFHYVPGMGAGAFPSERAREDRCIALLEEAIAELTAGRALPYESMTPAINDVWEPNIYFVPRESFQVLVDVLVPQTGSEHCASSLFAYLVGPSCTTVLLSQWRQFRTDFEGAQ